MKTKGNVMTSFNYCDILIFGFTYFQFMHIVFFFLSIYSFMYSYSYFSGIAALECYVCSYKLNQNDATCITNATAGRAINCTKKYCLTVRQELIVSTAWSII